VRLSYLFSHVRTPPQARMASPTQTCSAQSRTVASLPYLRKRPAIDCCATADRSHRPSKVQKPLQEQAQASPVALLDLPVDVLSNYIFVRPTLDICSLAVCRFVCRRLRELLPRKPAWDYWYDTALGLPRILRHLKPPLKDLDIDSARLQDQFLERAEYITGNMFLWQRYEINAKFWLRDVWQPWCKCRMLRLHKDQLQSGAVLCGYARVLQWSLGQGAPIHWHLLEEAAASGRLGILQLLLNHISRHEPELLPRCSIIAVLAAAGGHLRVVEWLYYYQMPDIERFCSFSERLTCLLSFRAGGSVNWLHNILGIATFYGNLHILEWLRDLNPGQFYEFFFRYSWNYEWVLFAGYTKILHWLHTFRRLPRAYECSLMVEVDRLDYLKWARKLGRSWNNKKVLHAAASRFCKNRDVLKYLHEEGVSWPDDFDYDFLMDPKSFGHKPEPGIL
jgi:hypothetical protein